MRVRTILASILLAVATVSARAQVISSGSAAGFKAYDQTAPASWPPWLVYSKAGVLGISTNNATSNAVAVSTGGSLTLAVSTVVVNGTNMFLIPSGAVMFFTGTTCPAGWKDFASNFTGYPSTSKSFYPVIRGEPTYATGTFTTSGGITMAGLTNYENRPTGQHSHTANDSHVHLLYIDDTADGGGAGSGGNSSIMGSPRGADNYQYTGPETGEPSIDNSSGASGVAGTNAPYYQLLMCQKN